MGDGPAAGSGVASAAIVDAGSGVTALRAANRALTICEDITVCAKPVAARDPPNATKTVTLRPNTAIIAAMLVRR
ncbi:MAG: hypothetical protein NTZ05_22090 [Chloroflexi bacterium]|nr:hypothetical protein [Chloroflexota bacterium]